MENGYERPSVSIQISLKTNNRTVGAALFNRIPGTNKEENELTHKIELFEFLDNSQFSLLDSFLTQYGDIDIYFNEDIKENKREFRKISNILNDKELTPIYLKKSLFQRTEETTTMMLKLAGKSTHTTNTIEAEKPLAFGSFECITNSMQLKFNEIVYGHVHILSASLDSYMRLDSAAADAVNLLPKKDQPSPFGSLFGILNRCKTKMGSRLLERWLRQPLIDKNAIDCRLNIVQLFVDSIVARNNIIEGPLKAVPDLDNVIARMLKKSAGLSEMYQLYVFVRTIPNLLDLLKDISAEDSEENMDENEQKTQVEGFSPKDCLNQLKDRIIAPLDSISQKFFLYERLVEHVVDMEQLPSFKINPKHDPELEELRNEEAQLTKKIEKIWMNVKNTWGNFTDIKLESSSQHVFIMRTTKGDDERGLRAASKSVRILSILKNGTHFTTPELEDVCDRLRGVQEEYQEKQQELVNKALETASTYLPVLETAAGLIAELDVLLSFATTAALAPAEYTRPKILPKEMDFIDLKNARHPCVELMDGVTHFVPNNCTMRKGVDQFQIVTGPNMGGKSTFIRSIGAIVVLAQVGMFVPCAEAEISVIDCVTARVGAGDAVTKGVSTFMAEMLESSVILQSASRYSLIIVDELGRGTSTFDGFGLAWAISHYILTKLQSYCLFATHFHELTALESHGHGACNRHVSAHLAKNQVVMLYRLASGACTQSFGAHVAAIAGFPESVLQETRKKARSLEHFEFQGNEKQENKDDTEERPKKIQKMEQALQNFVTKKISSCSNEKIVEEVKSLFPVEIN